MKTKNNKTIQEDISKLKLSTIEELLEILGFIDGKGQTCLDGKPGLTTYEAIQSFLLSAPGRSATQDMSRRIKTAIQFQKSMANEVVVSSSKSGFFVEPPNNWKKKPSYTTLCLLYLGIMVYEEEVSLDILDQLLEMKFPLLQLILWRRLIQNQKPLEFQYNSDRRQTTDQYACFFPVKLHLRDGHWRLIGWDANTEFFRSIPMHSIDKVKESQQTISKKVPKFSMEKYKKQMFGVGFNPDVKPVTAKIYVPTEYQNAVKKRKPLGIWFNNSKGSYWEITAHYPDEIYDYIFRWNGIIKLTSPEDMVEGFKKKCRSFLQ